MNKLELETKLKRLVDESIQELKDIGLGDNIHDNINYYVNYRAKNRLGQCCNKVSINISSWLLEIATDHDIKNTIIHEILHSFDNSKGHGEVWKYFASYVNMMTDYNITRLANVGEIYENAHHTRPITRKHYKYEITCEKCGKVFYRQRMTTRVMNGFVNGERVHTNCGGTDFRIVDLNNGELIW